MLECQHLMEPLSMVRFAVDGWVNQCLVRYDWSVFCSGCILTALGKGLASLQSSLAVFVLFSPCRCSCLRAGMEFVWDGYVAEA
jgi:hypothetical protein